MATPDNILYREENGSTIVLITTDQLPTWIAPASRLLTAAEFHRLLDEPPETEWFVNLSDPSTRRA
jgi:hypothetical protein